MRQPENQTDSQKQGWFRTSLTAKIWGEMSKDDTSKKRDNPEIPLRQMLRHSVGRERKHSDSSNPADALHLHQMSRWFKGDATRCVQGSCLGKLYFNCSRHHKSPRPTGYGRRRTKCESEEEQGTCL